MKVRRNTQALLILLVVVASLCFFLVPAALGQTHDQSVFGADIPAAQVPYDNLMDLSASGDIVAWAEYGGGIYYRYLSSGDLNGTLLIDDPNVQNVRVSSDPGSGATLFVWSDFLISDAGGFSQILVMPLGASTPVLLDPGPYNQGLFAVSGSRVLWTSSDIGSCCSDRRLLVKDVVSGQMTEVATGQIGQASMEGDWVAWSMIGDTDGYGNVRIHARNLSSGEEDVFSSGGPNQPMIRIGHDGDRSRIVWDGGGSNTFSVVHGMYDLKRHQMSVLPVPKQLDGNPVSLQAVEGNRAIYSEFDVRWANGGDASCPGCHYIHMFDLTTNVFQPVSQYASDHTNINFTHGKIIWADDRGLRYNNGSPGIYMNEATGAQSLVEKYAPELHFKHDISRSDRNDFEPRTVNLEVDAAEKLVITSGDINKPSLQDLINNPGSDSYLDLPGSPGNPFHSYADDYKNQLGNGDYPITTYARVIQKAEGTDKTVIQYWFNYYYNNWYNNHEGDWEMVEVILNGNLEPEDVAYDQHGWPWKKGWNEWGLSKTGTHPQVFVAEGSHASYFFESSTLHFLEPGTPNAFKDDTGSASWTIPAVDINGLNGGWADFAGLWGQSAPFGCWWCNDGPLGPAFQPRDPWGQPLTWANSSYLKGLANDMVIAAYSPVDINLYDPQGRHVGKNASGGVDMQIPGSEYFERADDHSKNIVIHNADILSYYTVKIEGTGTGTMDLKVQAPDFAGNTIDNPQYLAVNVNPAMQAELDLNPAKDFGLKVDLNGDGATDELRPPNTNNQVALDFTPPAAITDLAATDVTSGSATLTWTATGDDANQGTAFKYDLRYATQTITEDSWQYATPADSLPEPQVAGSPETATVTGLTAGTTYYFAVKARDDSWQESALSDVAQIATEIPNLTWSTKRIYWASWADYNNRQLSIDYNLGNSGNGIAVSPTIAASVCNPTSVYVTTPLPLTVPDLTSNSSSTVTLKYYVPTSVGSFTTTTYANCKDDAGRTYWFPGPMP